MKLLYIILISLACMSTAHADVVKDLVPTIIMAESSGRVDVSDGQSMGLMGISQCVVDDYNFYCGTNYEIWDMWDPRTNVLVGTWYLYRIQKQLPDVFKNSRAHLIFAYNSGLRKLKDNKWEIPAWTTNHPNKIYCGIYREYFKCK